MWIPKIIFDRLTSFSDLGLEKIIGAKQDEKTAVVSAKDAIIALLQNQIAALVREKEHERARAEAAIDELLKEKANVAQIRNADLQRDLAEKGMRDRAPYDNVATENMLKELNASTAEMAAID